MSDRLERFPQALSLYCKGGSFHEHQPGMFRVRIESGQFVIRQTPPKTRNQEIGLMETKSHPHGQMTTYRHVSDRPSKCPDLDLK